MFGLGALGFVAGIVIRFLPSKQPIFVLPWLASYILFCYCAIYWPQLLLRHQNSEYRHYRTRNMLLPGAVLILGLGHVTKDMVTRSPEFNFIVNLNQFTIDPVFLCICMSAWIRYRKDITGCLATGPGFVYENSFVKHTLVDRRRFPPFGEQVVPGFGRVKFLWGLIATIICLESSSGSIGWSYFCLVLGWILYCWSYENPFRRRLDPTWVNIYAILGATQILVIALPKSIGPAVFFTKILVVTISLIIYTWSLRETGQITMEAYSG